MAGMAFTVSEKTIAYTAGVKKLFPSSTFYSLLAKTKANKYFFQT
jgi:hypothetical protein